MRTYWILTTIHQEMYQQLFYDNRNASNDKINLLVKAVQFYNIYIHSGPHSALYLPVVGSGQHQVWDRLLGWSTVGTSWAPGRYGSREGQQEYPENGS
jgi:hypothetical protein